MASIIASDSNALIISTTSLVVSSSIKKYFQSAWRLKKGDFLGGVKGRKQLSDG
jgi:hypothetical protein